MGNYYGAKAKQLEQSLRKKLQQLALLEQENARLQHKEKALQDAIQCMEGPLAITKEALAGAAATPTCTPANSDVNSGASVSGGGGGQQSCASEQGQHSSNGGATCSMSSQGGGAGDRSTSSLPAATVASYRDTPSLLQHLEEREETVQEALQQLGGCTSGSYNQLYTTQLLRAATSQPARVQSHLAMTKPQRLKFVSETVARMSCLLPRYDDSLAGSDGGASSSSILSLSPSSISISPRQHVDNLVDDLLERIVVCALYDHPARYLNNLMVNMETQEFEPYPQGWWQQVVKAMCLTAEQKAAIKLVWDRVKSDSQALTQQFERLQQQLQQVHVQELQTNRQFEQEVKVLPFINPVLPSVRARQKQQEQERQEQEREQQQQLLEQQLVALLPVYSMQEQQQQQPQQQSGLCADLQLQALHDMWAQEAAAGADDNTAADAWDTAAVDALTGESVLEQLTAELHHAVHPQQQQQVQCQPQQAPYLHAAPSQQQQQQAYMQAGSLLQQQQQQQLYSPPPPSPATHAHAVAAASPHSVGGGLSFSAQSPQSGVQLSTAESGHQGHGGGSKGATGSVSSPALSPSLAVTPGTHRSQLGEAEEVLLQPGSEERQSLELRMQACSDRLKVAHFCCALNLTNTFTKKQLAIMCVAAHPFIADALSLCDALDEMGWD